MNVNEYNTLVNGLYGYNKQNEKDWRGFDVPKETAEIFKNCFRKHHIPFEASENYDLTHFEYFATSDETKALWIDVNKIPFMTSNEVRQAIGVKTSVENYDLTYLKHFTTLDETNTFPFNEKPFIVNVIFNEPATIVFWSDGTKTVVKAQNGEKFDKEKGLAMAIIKKSLGNKGSYFNEIKKWTGEI